MRVCTVLFKTPLGVEPAAGMIVTTPMQTFKVTRVYANASGDSCFEDISYPLTDGGPIGHLSVQVPVSHILFRKVPPGYDDMHTAPQRQYVILLDGAVEIETSLGQKRTFEPGEVLLMEDTTGKGHRSRNVKAVERSSLFIIV